MNTSAKARLLRPAVGRTGRDDLSPGRVWRQLVPLASEKSIGLVAALKAFHEDRLPLDGVLDLLEAGALTLLMDGPGGARGLLLADPQMVAALIEAQTTGRVTSVAPLERATTQVDAQLCSHVFDRWMTEFEKGMEAAGISAPVVGYRCGGHIEGERAIALALEDIDYRLYDLSFDLGDGARRGRLVLVYPYAAVTANGAGPANEGVAPHVMAARTEIRAVLCRIKEPYARLTGLAIGDLIEVPRASVGAVRLEVEGRRLVAKAKLGQMNGHKALRILPPEDPRQGPRPEVEGKKRAAPPSEAQALAGSLMELPGMAQGRDLPDLPSPQAGLPDLPPHDGGLPELPSLEGDLPDLPPLEGGLPELLPFEGDLPDLPPLDGLPDLPPL